APRYAAGRSGSVVPVHHARPRGGAADRGPGRGDEGRSDRGARHDRRGLRRPAAGIHPGPAGGHPRRFPGDRVLTGTRPHATGGSPRRSPPWGEPSLPDVTGRRGDHSPVGVITPAIRWGEGGWVGVGAVGWGLRVDGS